MDDADLPAPPQLMALADLLQNSLGVAKAELEKHGNPAQINIQHYLLGCASVIASIREMARVLSQGETPYTDEPIEQIEQDLRDLTEQS